MACMNNRQLFENILGKGEIARKEQFLLLPQCFLLNQTIVFPFVHIFDIISLFAAEFKGTSGKGLTNHLQSVDTITNDTVITLDQPANVLMTIGENLTVTAFVTVAPKSQSRFLFDAQMPVDDSACLTIRDMRVIGMCFHWLVNNLQFAEGILESVHSSMCLSVCMSVYKIQVFLYLEHLLQFCFNCI